ncbi:MAG: ribonuclease HII [Pseudomonadota bacterium]|uniref:Ribonuclease HII n=1 Tax=Candidatus Desulfatibia profunda TaxID=2841695 RepID=A0A8J6THV4_9BACT|nr:ribonuclease HII [Candidatus Desulfatibia profunda]MBL7180865.1 ribonuclease HII [Desulfobacterales bacterium]
MKPDLWFFEKRASEKGFSKIAGIDEAGRGPLAGPVVSAAVILPASFSASGITDSKKLTPKQRDYFFDIIHEHAVSVGIGIVGPSEIDRINILEASRRSMALSVENMSLRPDYLLIDGIFRISSDLPQKPIPKGDSLSVSIAAASIIAKVTRDRIMEKYHREYPQFGFLQHKGYPTKAHKAAIQTYGCCPIHRQSFKGVKEYL